MNVNRQSDAEYTLVGARTGSWRSTLGERCIASQVDPDGRRSLVRAPLVGRSAAPVSSLTRSILPRAVGTSDDNAP